MGRKAVRWGTEPLGGNTPAQRLRAPTHRLPAHHRHAPDDSTARRNASPGAPPTGQPTTSQQSTAAPARPASFSPAGQPHTAPRPDAAPRPDTAPARPASAAAASATQAHAAEPQTAVGVAQEKLRAATAGLGRFTTAAKEK